jgi:hypothetical protein
MPPSPKKATVQLPSPKLSWSGAKKRTYFNSFDIDRSEKGFVISRFAYVRFGEIVDCLTIVLTQALVKQLKANLLEYVTSVGLAAVAFESKMPEIPRYTQGRLELADVVDLGRSDDVGEIAFHVFSIRYVLQAVREQKSPARPEFVAILRSHVSLQINWIVSLYEESQS